jgi:hypothetical protein
MHYSVFKGKEKSPFARGLFLFVCYPENMKGKRSQQLIIFIGALALTLFLGFAIVDSAIDAFRHPDSMSGLTAFGLVPFFLAASYYSYKYLKPLLAKN